MTHKRILAVKLLAFLLLGLSSGWEKMYAAVGPVVITGQPTNLTALQGSPATFSVQVEGTSPFAFQWFRSGSPIAAATNASYTLALTAGTDNGAVFAVRVTNTLGTAWSSNATLRIDPGVIVTEVVNVLVISNFWKYNVSGSDLGTAWRAVGYDDSSWSNGFGVFDGKNNGARTTIAGETVRTALPTNGLSGKITTYYFRTHFTFSNANAATVQFRARTFIDDGALFYLNGKEALPFFVNSGAPYNAFATRTVSDASNETNTMSATNIVLGDNVVAAEVHQVNAGSSDITFALALDVLVGVRGPDNVPPVVSAQNPPAASILRNLGQVEVFFSEPVEGVDASDLLLNGVPATNLLAYTPSQFVFQFPVPPTGAVQVTWSPAHGIHDLAVNPNAFAPSSWMYYLDPNATPPTVVLNEFMAWNVSGLKDENGTFADWIELYNMGETAVNLNGWYLTDNRTNLTQWRFPNLTLLPNAYLLVFASGKDRTNVPGRLHTNFQLNKDGEYLALVDPTLAIVSEFAPAFPPQNRDVSYGRDRLNPMLLGYFLTPTPEAANSTSGAGFAPEVQFSRENCTFSQPFTLELSTPATNAEIRYVLVTDAGSAALTNIPTPSSLLYTGAISIARATQVRARAFQPEMLPGPPRTETYIPLDGNVLSYSSDLPIVVLYNFGAGSVPATADQPGFIALFEPVHGRASLTNKPTVAGRMGFNLRGSSTQGMSKSSFAVEFWDDYNQDRDVEVLGMPKESDWVFYAPNSFEPVLIHNAFAHALSREVGRYSPRTRFAEVYLNTSGGAITAPTPTSGDYSGIYLIEEKIKVADGRVDVDKIDLGETNLPAISGGYLFKVDRADGDERTFSAANQGMVYQYPDGLEMQTSPRAAQANYVQSYFNNFYAALTGPNWTNSVTGYRAYVDVDSWIDHHLLNVLTFNVDCLRLSAYLYKPRNGPLNMGPLWDFDRALGSADGRDFNPRIWRSHSGDWGTDFFGNSDVGGYRNPWYSLMLADVDFWQRYIDRYQELRRSQFSTGFINNLIDTLTGELREAQAREQARWGGFTSPRSGTRNDPAGSGYSYYFNGTYQGEIDFLKKWLADRADFMDTNFVAAPVLSVEGGPVPMGFYVALSAQSGSTLYYTLDGTDPRTWNTGGQIAANALVYTAPFMVTNNVRVVARAFDPSHSNLTGANNPPISSSWSGPVMGTFYVSTPPLRVTEIMYHPKAPPAGSANDAEDFEYIEVKNISPESLNVAGFRLHGGIDFVFPDLVLAGGQSAVVVANMAAFQIRYGPSVLIAGQYSNRLDNAGEHLLLEGAAGEPILDFEYKDGWYPITDGLGFSLVIRNEDAAPNTWGLKQSWRPSGSLAGSPGLADPDQPAFPQVVINEVLTHTDPPAVDSVEIYNLGNSPADISGWLLTDDSKNPNQYRIPSPTIIAAHGFVVFTETNFNVAGSPHSFAFSSKGDSVYLYSAEANTNLTGFVHGFDFGAVETGVTFGRYVTSTGEEHFPAQAAPTLGATNAGPRVGPIVISEIMYHPPDSIAAKRLYDNTEDEYIELSNITASPVPLYHTNYTTNTWRLQDAVSYVFPTNVILAPNSYALVVAFDPDDTVLVNDFRARYGLANNVPLFGPFSGKLQNDEESLELMSPDNPEPPGTADAGFVPYVLVERVKYSEQQPWPVAADGMGQSLQRINAGAYGNDPANWLAASPTPGSGYAASGAPVISAQPTNQAVRAGANATFVVAATGPATLRYQWRFNGRSIIGATNYSLLLTNVLPSQAGQYQCVVMNAGNAVASSVANLNVMHPPALLINPQPQYAWGSTNPATYGTVTSNITFSCMATGSLPLVFQWRFNGANLPGATNALLTLANATKAQEGNYSVLVSNSSGSVTSAPVALGILWPMSFVEHPQSTNIFAGNTVTFRVRIQGGPPPFGYLWQRDGVVLTNIVLNATNASYIITDARLSDMGTYTVTVTNASNPTGITSLGARLGLVQAPTVISIIPSNHTVLAGGTVTFRVTATGDGPLGYRWMYQYGFVPGETSATLVLTNIQPSQEGNYRAVVSNAAGSSSSAPATLSVLVPPTLSQSMLLSNGLFRALVSGKSNRTFRIEYSTNLSNWATLSTLTYTNSQMPFTDSAATNSSQRFYRANSN